MDLSKLSDEDLIALKGGDLSKVSDQGLMHLKGGSAPEPSFMAKVGQQVGNAGAGLVRGAGSIGATILAPVDAAARAMGVQNDYIGRTDRRESMTNALESLGAQPDSLAFQGGKLAGEIAGTAGAGGVLANGVRAAGAAVNGGRALASVNPIAEALATGGFRAGGAGLGTRMAGGAVTGGATAGLVNPEDAGMGAAVGGALPVVAKGAGFAGNKIGRLLRGPEQAPELANAITAARDAGYVIPPTQAKASLGNRLLEGFSGKITTAQNASAKNQTVTNSLAAKAVGLPEGVAVTPESLNAVREEAGKAYQALAALPERPPVASSSLTNTPAVAGFSPKQALLDLRQARNDATGWFTAYGRSASPDDQTKAKAAAAVASKLESQFEEYAKALGREDLVPAMQDARRLIAKTYSIEKAMTPGGSIDARKLAAQLAKGKPLSDELKTAAEFGGKFPKAAQTIEGMGSLPQTSPLDWALAGGAGLATANPLAMAAVAARPVARAASLSPLVQNRLIQAAQGGGVNPELLQFGYRAAPLIGRDR